MATQLKAPILASRGASERETEEEEERKKRHRTDVTIQRPLAREGLRVPNFDLVVKGAGDQEALKEGELHRGQ